MPFLDRPSYFFMQPETICDQTVLELGCGSGFLGIIVATIQQTFNKRRQSHHQPLPAVLLTDVNAGVLSRCRDNIRLRCSEWSHLTFILITLQRVNQVDVLCPAPFQSDFFFCLVCLDQLMPCFECAVVTYRRVDQSSNHPNITFSTLDWFDALSLPLGENAVTSFLSKAGAGIVIGADIVRLKFAVTWLLLT